MIPKLTVIFVETFFIWTLLSMCCCKRLCPFLGTNYNMEARLLYPETHPETNQIHLLDISFLEYLPNFKDLSCVEI